MCFSCGDKLAQVVKDRLLQRGVRFDRGDQDGQVPFELVGYIRYRGVVLREFLFCFDEDCEMVRDKVAELVKRNEGRLDIVDPRRLSGHPGGG